MSECLDELVEALRAELIEYGAMLALIDDQRGACLGGGSRTVDASADCHEKVVETVVRKRVAIEQRYARVLGLSEAGGVGDLLGRLPESHRGLVQALAEENERLRARLRPHRPRPVE